MSITDVLRASLAEVEEYRRVTLRRVEPAHLTGAVVAEIAHLLAELIENALSFSPPDSDVEIEGRRTSAGYLVAIVDHGLGMDAQAIAEANVRLSGTASFMAEPTRFLGHFVVGALARKCGIEVRLGEAPAAGVVARVLVPDSLLTEAAAAPKQQAAAAVPAPRREPDETQLVSVAAEARPEQPKKGASAARTRNGLVKRPQRSAISEAVSETDRPSRPAPAERTPDRSPEEVSGMLATLRSAHMRGGISVEKEKRKEKEQAREQEQASAQASEARTEEDGA
ncbi:ATP-binding protein [Streptomyces sp.]|uniref:ATP-binding protein n=1 Tax=Streptomyces sp. TaxID=1931 RepID=UPI003452A167